ncbi:MAG: hypothetical protein II811_01400 [Spirochaetaceae bacterium]|nr:hypothetical protein [Spirochaetaceae bacterium]
MKMMKKMIAVVVAALVSVAAFAEESQDLLFFGVGPYGNYSNVHVFDDGNRSIVGGGLVFNLLAVKNLSGFSTKCEIGAGVGSTKDVPNEDHMTNVDCFGSAGFGYSFVRTEDTVFSLLGMVHAKYISFNGDNEITVDTTKYDKDSISFFTVGIGADATFVKRISNNIHFFAAVGAYYNCFGTENRMFSEGDENKSNYVGSSRSITGNISVTPSLGVMWKLK